MESVWAALIGSGALGAIGLALRHTIQRVYSDMREDRERTLLEHAQDRQRYREERKEWQQELLASREERAECRAKLAALEETVRSKLFAGER